MLESVRKENVATQFINGKFARVLASHSLMETNECFKSNRNISTVNIKLSFASDMEVNSSEVV